MIINTRSANDGAAGKKGPQPAEMRTDEIPQPDVGIGNGSWDMECVTALGLG